MNSLEGKSIFKRVYFDDPSLRIENGKTNVLSRLILLFFSPDEGSLNPKRFNINFPSHKFITFGLLCFIISSIQSDSFPLFTSIYIYIYICVCVCVCACVCVCVCVCLWNIIDIFCLHIFFVNPLELPYWSYDIRRELVDKPSIIIFQVLSVQLWAIIRGGCITKVM